MLYLLQEKKGSALLQMQQVFSCFLCPRVSSGAASAAPNKNRKSLTFLAFRFFLFMCVCSSGRHQNFLPSDERDGSHWNGKEGGVFLHRPGNPPQHSLSTSRRWNIQLVRCSAIAFHEVCCLRLLELSCLLVDNFGKVWKRRRNAVLSALVLPATKEQAAQTGHCSAFVPFSRIIHFRSCAVAR